jgi:iron complex outermembrane receptor protein
MYRKVNRLLPILTGNVDYTAENSYTPLEPEFVNSLQLTFAGLEWLKGMNFEVNGFYNRANNLIHTHIIEYLNEGTNKTAGVEFLANYRKHAWTVDFNLTWTHTFEANVSMKNIDDNNNTPAIMSNAVVSWQATPRLRLHSHVLFEGKQTTYNLDIVEMINSYQIMTYLSQAISENNTTKVNDYSTKLQEVLDRLVMHKDIPARFIFNIGAEYKWNKLTFGLNVRNLFNHKYYRSGMNTNVVFQKGRWFMFDVAYHF